MLTSPHGIAQTSSSESAASASSAQSSEKPIYISSADRDNQLLAKAFSAIAKADEILWLETPSEKIVSLIKPGEERKVKGALMILHAPETPQLWPATLENLRRNLPIYGWTTLAVPLPAKYATDIPAREIIVSASSDEASSTSTSLVSSSASSAASESPKPALPRSQLIAERIEAAVGELNKTGQFNLAVMVDNSSAPDALASLYKKINAATTDSDTVDGPLQALILINLQNQEPLTKEQLDAIFSVKNVPVMDVFFIADNAQLNELRRKHRAEAMRQNLKDYEQLVLPTEQQVGIDDKQSFWLGRVHGFLERKAEGNELSKKEGDKSNIK